MKKILFIIVVLFLITTFNREVEAECKYKNLINPNYIEYDEKNNKFYCNQEIELFKDISYTFVARYNFFGEVTKSSKNALDESVLGVKYISGNSADSGITFVLNYVPTGLYYATITPKTNSVIKFDDLLTKGYDIETLPKEEIIFFEGTTEKFQGFRCNEDFDGYSRVENSLNL